MEEGLETLGTVKWFNATRGYGFIVADDSVNQEANIFVHYSAIDSEDHYKRLYEKQRVKFKLQLTAKGLSAKDVRVIRGQ